MSTFKADSPKPYRPPETPADRLVVWSAIAALLLLSAVAYLLMG